MTFPYAFHANFETGTKDAFDTESDSGNRLDYPGPQQLVRDQMAVFPHRGAYCARVNLGKNSTDAYLEEGVSWALDSTNYGRFELMIGDDVQIGNDGDMLDIMTLVSTGPVNEGHLTLARVEPQGMVLGLRDASGTLQDLLKVEPGDWMCVEFEANVDAGGGNDGSITVWIGDDRIRLSGLDQAAHTAVRFGAMNQTGDFTGHIYLDEVVFGTTRLFPDYGAGNMMLDGETMFLGKSGWAFVGEGSVDGVTLVSGSGAASTVQIFDTDDVNYSFSNIKEALAAASAGVAQSQPLGDSKSLFTVKRGCYVDLTGSGAFALVRLGQVDTGFDEDDE